jgi:hypothetical protein
VPAVIAMYSIITPEAAKEFFTALYRALARCGDMVAAYAAAVKALRTDVYQNRSLWSVPVLYANDNVIPFPGTLGGPRGSYQQIVDQVAGLRAELSAVQPEGGWSDSTWRRETLRLLVNANGRRCHLRQLIDLVQHERSGSMWAAEVSDTAQDGLLALDRVVAHASDPRRGADAADQFAASKAQLSAALDELHYAISVRLRFSQ